MSSEYKNRQKEIKSSPMPDIESYCQSPRDYLKALDMRTQAEGRAERTNIRRQEQTR